MVGFIDGQNAWASHILPEFTNIITQGRGTLAAIQPSPAYLEKPFTHSYGERWDGKINNYFLQLDPPHNTIILGGARQAQELLPVSEVVNNDEEHLQFEGCPDYFKRLANRDFIGWDGEEVTELELGDDNGGVWTGGMPRILLSSHHIAPLILDSLGIANTAPPKTEAYPPIPEPFKLSAERLEKLRAMDPPKLVNQAVADGITVRMENVALDGAPETDENPLVDSIMA
ncbi:hypothetical protein P7C73_g464, partial [Tremellales sp. Uapishka_1]